jgi:hypothetical protein
VVERRSGPAVDLPSYDERLAAAARAIGIVILEL